MAESQSESDDGISTANINAKIVKDVRLQYDSHDHMVMAKNVSEKRDLIVLINRVSDEHGDVTGVEKVSDDIVIIYCNSW